MTPTEELRHEHDVILLVLQGAEKQVDLGTLKQDNLNEMLDFFVNFVDSCHHAKEEKHLFPKLEERGISGQGGPVEVMLGEHSRGRALVASMKERAAGWQMDKQATSDLGKDLFDYVALMRQHIDKENNVLFPMADKGLTPEEQESLSNEFAAVESEEMGEGVHERYHEMAHRLAGA